MTKRKKLGAILLGAILALGVGAGVGASRVEAGKAANLAAEADFTLITAKSNAYNAVFDYGDWKVYAAANNNGGWAFMKFGGKSTTIATANPAYTRGSVAGSVSSIDVVFDAGSLSKTGMSVNFWGVKVFSDDYTTQIDSVLGGTILTTAHTLSLTPADAWPANSRYEVYFDLANTSTTNGIICVKKIQFVEAVDASKDLVSLGFTGVPTTTVYNEGDEFDPNGLTITATYSDTTTADVTSQVLWEALTVGMTSVTGTYSYNGISSVSKTVDITGLTVNPAPVIGGIVDGHTYLITGPKATDGTPYYILKSDVEGAKVFESTKSGDFTEQLAAVSSYSSTQGFVFTKVGVNEYEIKSGDNYLGAIADNNGLVLGTTADTWKVTEAVGTTSPGGVAYSGVFLQDTNSGRYLTVFAGTPNFRTYTGTTSQPLPAAVISLHDMTALEGFANSFNTAIGVVCDADGETEVPVLATAWSNQATAFNGLLATEKAIFEDAEAKISGTVIQQSVAKYDYVARKYNVQLLATGWDFMERNIAPISPTQNTFFNALNDNNTIMLIVIISLISVSVLGGVFYLRKREQN